MSGQMRWFVTCPECDPNHPHCNRRQLRARWLQSTLHRTQTSSPCHLSLHADGGGGGGDGGGVSSDDHPSWAHSSLRQTQFPRCSLRCTPFPQVDHSVLRSCQRRMRTHPRGSGGGVGAWCDDDCDSSPFTSSREKTPIVPGRSSYHSYPRISVPAGASASANRATKSG